MQCASSITSSPTRSANSGSISARNCGLSSRSGLIRSTSTASAASSSRTSAQASRFVELIGVGADPDPLGGGDLVAHQREQRRDDQRRARRPPRAAARWRGSRRPTCPSRCAARTARARGRRRGRAPPRAGARGTRPRARELAQELGGAVVDGGGGGGHGTDGRTSAGPDSPPRRSAAVAFVYLLRCADGSLYCGWTIDVEKRARRARHAAAQPLHRAPAAGRARGVVGARERARGAQPGVARSSSSRARRSSRCWAAGRCPRRWQTATAAG